MRRSCTCTLEGFAGAEVDPACPEHGYVPPPRPEVPATPSYLEPQRASLPWRFRLLRWWLHRRLRRGGPRLLELVERVERDMETAALFGVDAAGRNAQRVLVDGVRDVVDELERRRTWKNK